MRLLSLIVLLFAVCFGTRSVKAETPTQETQIDLDSVGDGTVEIKEHYTAQAWLRWKASVGDHPDWVVRNEKRDFAAWEFYDFSFSKDEVSRISESKMKVRALAQIAKDGNYALDKLPSGLHLVTGKGNEWIFSGFSQEDETERTVHVSLPGEASNAHIINPDTSQTELVYSIVRPASKSSPLLLLSGGFGAFGILMLGISLRVPKIHRQRQPLSIKTVTQAPAPALPDSSKWQLIGRTPGGRTIRLEITDAMFSSNGGRLVLGRTAELCHVVIDDGSVSKQHAQIRREGGSFMVADRNSSNGTAVNGQFGQRPFDEVPLKDGDTITLGEVKLDFSKG
ncbi:MAG: FHA domain-containing protein [Verrucomicrobia bacterium]|nr:FHA domain-containing protein [Verrucomicrobiota bacterium]